jgi:TonB family protein
MIDRSAALLSEQLGDKYEVLSRIRVGGMGAIYKVRHRLLDEIRIVKAIRHPEASGTEADRFLHEARAATRLHHPNVAVLHDFALGKGGQAFIVMEHIPGWNLSEILRGYGPPPLALTIEIAHQTLKALGYLHRLKIVHHDISPDNLMLARDPDGNPLVKLIDLGIARFLDECHSGGTVRGFFAGKPRYGSPERLRGADWDERSDLYSFGVVFYELLTGCCPIAGNDTEALMAGHLFLPPRDFLETDPGYRVPEELRQLVLMALSKDPKDRPASADEFLWQLTMIQDRFPLNARYMDALWCALRPAIPGRAAVEADAEADGPATARTVLDRPLLKPGARSVVPPWRTQEMTLRDGPPASAVAKAARSGSETTLVEPPPRPAANAGPSAAQHLDETWASRPLHSVDTTQELRARDASARRTVWVTLAASVVILSLSGAWSFWAPPIVETAIQAAPQDRTRQIVAAASHPVAAVLKTTEPPAPSPSPAPLEANVPPAARPRPATPPAPVPEMRPGDLILASQPRVEAPELISLPSYSLPAGATPVGQKVSIRVALLVDESGQVLEARVKERGPSGGPFEAAALEAAKKAKFFPPLRDGVPGKMWTELLFEF